MKHRTLKHCRHCFYFSFRRRPGPGRRVLRKAHHRQEAAQRPDPDVCERPEAPVFSFFTLVDAGSAQDPMGATGLAHMFEHMAFKGTDKIGTTDYAAEKPALAKVEVAYAAYIAERDKTVGRDEAKLKQLEKAWKDAIDAADKYRRRQRVRQNRRTEWRRRHERLHQLRRDRISLFPARKPARTVGLS